MPAVGKGDPLGPLTGGIPRGVEQKQDKLLLFLIKRILHIKNVIRFSSGGSDKIYAGGYSNSNNFVLSTMNSYAINNIIKQFSNKFIGVNSLIFSV